MRTGILLNKKSGTNKVMVFEKPHTDSSILRLVENNTKCEILEGPMMTEDRYPGIHLYKVKTDELTGYVNIRYVKVKRG